MDQKTDAQVVPGSFFQRPAVKVARDLIGMSLVRSRDKQLTRVAIIETEAYEGPHDLASHSAKGRTPRTEVMYGPGGRFYVYRIYGLHWMLNIVAGGVGEAAGVLIRGVEGISGPGRVCAALAIDGSFYGKEVAPSSGLWVENAEPSSKRVRILRTPRIGVDFAGPIWAAKKLRFIRA